MNQPFVGICSTKFLL